MANIEGGAGGAAAAGSPVASGGTRGDGLGGATAGSQNNGRTSRGGNAADGTSSGGTSTGGVAAGGMNSGGAFSGAGGDASGGSSGAAGTTGSVAFTLTSPDHMDGAKFAGEFTCALAGFNGSIIPELRWTAGPADTKSYAITFVDVTLTQTMPPNMNGYHWAIWNIPASTTSLAKGFKDAASIRASQTGAFLGPCPNIVGSGHTDTYEFTIYALASETLTPAPVPTTGTAAVKDAGSKLEMMQLASAKLTGTSDAKPP